MNERADPSTLGDANQAGGSDANAAAVHAGAMLRQARESHGLQADAMAFSLKVPVAKLEALEAGRLDLLPDVVFARGLAASMCRNLKVDAAPVLELLPRNASGRVGVQAPSINTPFRPPGSGPNFAARGGRMVSPAVIVVVVLMVGALLLLIWPKIHEEAESVTAAGEPPPPTLIDPAATPTPAPAEIAASSAVAAGVPVTAGTASVAPAAPAAVAVPAASAPGVEGGIFVLSAKADSWVKVTDAKGVVSLNRIIKPGETVRADGALPMAVIIGRADAVQVQVRGQPLDLVPMTKVNVARFEVK